MESLQPLDIESTTAMVGAAGVATAGAIVRQDQDKQPLLKANEKEGAPKKELAVTILGFVDKYLWCFKGIILIGHVRHVLAGPNIHVE